MILRILTILALLASPAWAQQSPENKAYTLRIGQEINASLACSVQVFTLQDKLAASEAEVKRLTDKYEPKKDDPVK